MRRVIRAPNHLGDLVMALPALTCTDADLVVVRGLLPIATLAVGSARVIPLDRDRRGYVEAARRLRRGRYDEGVLLPPSFSSAALFAAGGVRRRRGLSTDARRLLLTDPLPRASIRGMHRASAYTFLVSGTVPTSPPVPRLVLPAELGARGIAFTDGPGRRRVGIFPGANASSRRWDPDRFRELARRLVEAGDRVIVFGGPAEREITALVAGEVALDAGGRTDLPLLAAALAACDILITNDSGPMHLAAALGVPTISLIGAANPVETAPLGPAHRMLRRADLPCVPCVKNVCPRSGPGYVLPQAERECLRLIEVRDVLAAATPPR